LAGSGRRMLAAFKYRFLKICPYNNNLKTIYNLSSSLWDEYTE
jgi:hypothetical protein